MRNTKHNKKLDKIVSALYIIAFVVVCYIISDAILTEIGV